MGPSPERGRPRLWLGGYQPVSVDRALRYGDGYVLGAPGLDAVRARLPEVRQRAADAGRSDFPVGALAYVVASTDPAVVAEAERIFVRYYGPLQQPFSQRARIGDGAAVRDLVAAYAEAGLDELHLLPIGSTTDQVDLLASEVLPAARSSQAG
jgi:alkanesulfonate monooxygenase SsuD/methylene tetrahydromethanopterin reductase-like flavin-dependent oxidoreductase (luciferase family)